ncbi:MAG: WbqC family protein [Bacteroidales bacterium]|nr:WbqC family protein [Bacteroidales bacterium]MBQ5582770.1 WbqC family protein [Bacteroidales bacterium]
MTLTIAYFPPIEYFALLAKYSSVFMEAHESFQKQSYRNRCHIYAENGVQSLNFPIQHSSKNLPITEVLVDYSTPWLLKTKRCIDTAYHSSAFFDYYRDELYAILDEKPETLWDLDMNIIKFFMSKIGIATQILPTDEYGLEISADIHPKRPNTILNDLGLARPYYQVFSQRCGFISNLSVMDLLFNEGPASLDYLL